MARVDLPAEPQEVQDALRRAKEAIDALRPDVTQPINQVRQFAAQAEQQAASAASSAANIAQTALLAPLQTLGNMLTDLVNHPEHIFDPSRIVDDAITQITTQAITTMTQVHDAVMSQAKATLESGATADPGRPGPRLRGEEDRRTPCRRSSARRRSPPVTRSMP